MNNHKHIHSEAAPKAAAKGANHGNGGNVEAKSTTHAVHGEAQPEKAPQTSAQIQKTFATEAAGR